MKHKAIVLVAVISLFVVLGLHGQNQSIYLDGNGDYASVTGGNLWTGMSGATGITIEAWVNPSSLRSGSPVDSYRNIIVDFCIQSTNSMVSMYLRENGKIRLGGRSQNSDAFVDLVTATSVVSTGSWQHVAGVLDFTNKTLSLYVDGTLVASRTGAPFGSNTFIPGTGGNQFIGAGASLNANHYFHGYIDDMRLWSIPRSASDITTYKDGMISAQANLLAYWKLDDTNDSSGHDYHLTLFGDSTFEAGNPTLPVELASFSAVLTAEYYVRLHWVTHSETSVSGFYIYRGNSITLSNAIKVSPLIGATNTTNQHSYDYEDTELSEPGTYYYWLCVQNMDGSVDYHGPNTVFFDNNTSHVSPEIPSFSGLNSIFPNPFYPSTTVSYSLTKDSNVKITIYNARGQVIRRFYEGSKSSGVWNIHWDGKDDMGNFSTSGIYIFRMIAGDDIYIKKAVLMQ